MSIDDTRKRVRECIDRLKNMPGEESRALAGMVNGVYLMAEAARIGEDLERLAEVVHMTDEIAGLVGESDESVILLRDLCYDLALDIGKKQE